MMTKCQIDEWASMLGIPVRVNECPNDATETVVEIAESDIGSTLASGNRDYAAREFHLCDRCVRDFEVHPTAYERLVVDDGGRLTLQTKDYLHRKGCATVKMTVARLKEILEDLDDSAEVRLAFQPNYPFEYTIEAVEEVVFPDGKTVVYIAEGGQTGFLPSTARETLGWTR